MTLGLLSAALLQLTGLSEPTILVASNLIMIAAAGLACVACALAARRAAGRRRATWAWLAVATGAWTAGQLGWSYYVAVLDVETPFPSPADFAFLVFPIAASVAMVIWLGSHSSELAARGRDVMDGAIIAGSLLVLSWVTALGAVIDDGTSDNWLSLTLALAYPIGDVILGTLVLLALVRGAPHERFTLGVLAVGLGGVALSDSALVYFVSQSGSWSGDIFGIGWYFGFLLVAVAAATDAEPATDAVEVDDVGETSPHTDVTLSSLLRLALPYVPLLAALAALGRRIAGSASALPAVDLMLGVALVLIVLTRQFLAMVDNLRLVVAVQEGRNKLEYLALHDPLTDLANRGLFADRLDRALLRQSASVGVLFCDLDNFKQVNDVHGHEAGDALLRCVAERLLTCVRTTDTVARLGGDEFAILLADSSDAVHVAERIVSSLSQPFLVTGASVRTSVSIGIAHHQGLPIPADDRRGVHPRPERFSWAAVPTRPGLHAASAQQLLHAADTAMYRAKNAGKSQAVLAEVDIDEILRRGDLPTLRVVEP